MTPPRRATAFLAPVLLTALASAQGLYLGPDVRPHDPPVPPHRPVRPPHRPHRPPVRLTDLAVRAEIVDGAATTELRQTFRNDGPAVAEGTWILPLPPGAAADRFTMTVNGKETPGEVLDKDKARRIYEDIVRRRRDPGLLEYLGHGCLRARIFPIPARGRIDVLVRYRQTLRQSAGIHEWTFPLRAAGVGGRGSDRVSLDLTIRSSKAIKNVYSPLAGVEVRRQDDHEARVSFETQRGQMPARDLQVFYSLSDREFGLNLLTYRKPGSPGWFLMMLAPKQEWAEPENTRKVISFVLDTSGSMQGKKIEQARGALRFFLRSLRSRDWFNVVPFSTEARPFFPAPVAASEENVAEALRKVAEIEARGGTNIEDGLRQALDRDLPEAGGMTQVPVTVFLTDGLPTVGTTDVRELISLAGKINRNRARVFVFGVGDDVNTRLLDRIAEDSRGDRDYVREHESIEVKTGALFTKLSHPVLTEVEIACEGIEGFDMFPKRTPDLFKGSRVLVVGRYRGAGGHAIRLRGVVNGQRHEYVFEGAFAERATEHDFVPALWAQRKVAYLLDQIRLHGRKKELVDEVTRLGKEFGIVTPFTSHLILEEGQRLARARGLDVGRSPGDLFGRYDDRQRLLREYRRAGAPVAEQAELEKAAGDLAEQTSRARRSLERLDRDEEGKKAVDYSVALGLIAKSKAPSATGAGRGVTELLRRRVKDRTFYLAGGVWTDTAYRAEMRDRVREVEAFSDEYFALLRERPELAPYLAFSTRILLVLGEEVIEIV